MQKAKLIRERISSLTSAQKGSFFENFYLNKVDKTAIRISHLGVNADIQLKNGKMIDLKMWKNKPRKPDTITIYWLDYLTKKSQTSGTTNIISLLNGEEESIVLTYTNKEIEDYYSEFEKSLKWERTNKMGSQVNSNKELLLNIMKKYLIEKYPFGKTRFLNGQLRRAKNYLIGPAIYWQNQLKKYDRTIFIVATNDWTEILEYWVFDHTIDFSSYKEYLVPDRKETIKYRFKKFPENWKFKFIPSLTIENPRPPIKRVL